MNSEKFMQERDPQFGDASTSSSRNDTLTLRSNFVRVIDGNMYNVSVGYESKFERCDFEIMCF